ncbi:hypothetical protein J3Q09_26015 [Pseudomonas sp. R4-83]|uniref:DUF7706 family protein n=1 Tax=unclassified Pseudomonas TaxID=196821 RepID=UPI003DA82760
MNNELVVQKPITFTVTTPAGASQSEFMTEAETSALAQFVKRVGWFEFNSHSVNEDEAHLVKQAVDKLQNVLSRSGFDPL